MLSAYNASPVTINFENLSLSKTFWEEKYPILCLVCFFIGGRNPRKEPIFRHIEHKKEQLRDWVLTSL